MNAQAHREWRPLYTDQLKGKTLLVVGVGHLGGAGPDGMEAASLVAAVRPLMPPPPAGVPGLFALSDESALRKFAVDAGLVPVEVFDVDSPFVYPDEAAAIRGLNATGVAARAMENSTEQAVTEAHAKAIAPFRQSDGSFVVEATFRCLLAQP